MSRWWQHDAAKGDSPTPPEKKKRMKLSLSEKLFLARELAEKFRCNVDHIYDLMREGKLLFIEVGGKKLVPEREVESYLERKIRK